MAPDRARRRAARERRANGGERKQARYARHPTAWTAFLGAPRASDRAGLALIGARSVRPLFEARQRASSVQISTGKGR